MEPLIRALNDPKNQSSSETIQHIQRELQQLQRQPTAWQGGLDLLNHQEANVRFYGALTLTIKINADWQVDQFSNDEQRRSSLLKALVASYVRLCLAEEQTFVMQRLASTLALLYQKIGAEWQHPVRHLLASVIAGEYLSPYELPPMHSLLLQMPRLPAIQIAGIFLIVRTLSEDVSSKVQGSDVHKQLALNSGDALELIAHVLVSHCRRYINPQLLSNIPPTGLQERDAQTVSELALDTFSSWIGLFKLHDSTGSKAETTSANKSAVISIQACIDMLNSGALEHHPLQALITTQTLSPRLITKASPDFIAEFAKLPFTQKWASVLVHGDFSPEALLFAELVEAMLLHVDLTEPDYLISGRYNGILEMVLTLLRCEGAAVVEDQACRTMLEIATNIFEAFTDWDPEPTAEQFLRGFAQQACEACLAKCKYPSDELSASTREWDKEDIASFREFRLDVEDCLLAAYPLLGRPLVDAISASVRKGPPESDWADFEASLVCLLSFVDKINSDEESYNDMVGSILRAHYFQQVLQSQDAPDAVRKTCITFLAGMTAYLKSHPSLPQILNFLFSSLQQSSSAAAASRAIHTLCDSQRASLVDALPGFLASLVTISHLHGASRNRIYGAVSAVVQALPDPDKIQPLHQILELVQRDVQQSASLQKDDEEFQQYNTYLLQTLAAIGKGLRDSDDKDSQNGNHATSTNIFFWTDGPGTQIQQKVLDIYRSIMHRVGLNVSHDLVEASCDFITSGFPESHPSPFKFDVATSSELVTSHISVDTPNIDAAMSMASGLLAVVSREEFQPHFQKLVHLILGNMQQLLASENSVTRIRESLYPAASLDFMSRLLPRSHAQSLLESAEAQQALQVCLELALVVFNEPDTLPRRSAANFFGAFTELSKPGKVADGVARQNVEASANNYNPRIIASLLRLAAGDCLRSEIDIMSDQIRRYVIAQPMAFKRISREAMKDESAVLSEKALRATSMDQRSRFLAQVDGLRGSRKTNDIVRAFWLSCRGDEFNYIL